MEWKPLISAAIAISLISPTGIIAVGIANFML
jgi:hypothetical protein